MERDPNKQTDMTESPIDPSAIEEVFMKCLFYLNGGELDNEVSLEDLKKCIIDKTDIKEENFNIEKVYTRLKLEGFVAQTIPGKIKMMFCGDLDFSDTYEDPDQ